MVAKEERDSNLPDETIKQSVEQNESNGTHAKKFGLSSIDFSNINWKRKDVYVTILLTLICFGDAVEIYLPGVITRSAARDLGVSKTREGILGIILYIFMALSFFILPAIKAMIGRKTTLLASLYTSIISTVFCALVPNYWALIVSRALLGFCIGLNMSIANVYFSEEVSSYEIYNLGKVAAMFSFTLGGGWSAVLGYLLLSKIGWRYFIVCTSVPIFIPPLCILHCVLKEGSTEERVGLLSKNDTEAIEVDGFWGRVIKGSIADFINNLQGWGSILLIPALLTYLNKQGGPKDKDISPNEYLLIQALLYGGVKLLGRFLGVFLLKFIRFRILQPSLAIIMACCYLVLILMDHNLIAMVVAMGISNMCFSVGRGELSLMRYDKHYFGTRRLALATGMMGGCSMLGALVGTTTAQFLSTPYAVILTFALSCVQVVNLFCITER